MVIRITENGNNYDFVKSVDYTTNENTQDTTLTTLQSNMPGVINLLTSRVLLKTSLGLSETSSQYATYSSTGETSVTLSQSIDTVNFLIIYYTIKFNSTTATGAYTIPAIKAKQSTIANGAKIPIMAQFLWQTSSAGASDIVPFCENSLCVYGGSGTTLKLNINAYKSYVEVYSTSSTDGNENYYSYLYSPQITVTNIFGF